MVFTRDTDRRIGFKMDTIPGQQANSRQSAYHFVQHTWPRCKRAPVTSPFPNRARQHPGSDGLGLPSERRITSIAPTSERLGQLAEAEGNLMEALRLYEESYHICERLGTLHTANARVCVESLIRVRQALR